MAAFEKETNAAVETRAVYLRVGRRTNVDSKGKTCRFKLVRYRHIVAKETISSKRNEFITMKTLKCVIAGNVYLGIFLPTTPAKTVPVWRPIRIWNTRIEYKMSNSVKTKQMVAITGLSYQMNQSFRMSVYNYSILETIDMYFEARRRRCAIADDE